MKKYTCLILIMLVCWMFTIPVSAGIPDRRGDVNDDGIVSASDALAVLKHATILDTLNDKEGIRANVNRDNSCDAKDALCILKYAATLISSFDEVAKTITVKTAEVDYANVRIARAGYGDTEDTRKINTKIISDYDEYAEYINMIENTYYSWRTYEDVDLYLPEFFDNNILFVADFWEGSGSISHKFMNVTESDGKTVILLEEYSPGMGTCDMAHWELMVPLAGKDRKLEDISVEFELLRGINGWYSEFTDELQSVNNGEDYMMVLSDYEEYQAYLNQIRQNNPDFQPKHVYSESEFEYLVVVAGGFNFTGGQLELSDIDATEKNENVNINFDFKCSRGSSEKSGFYSYILSYDKFTYNDISYTTDIEYYEVAAVDESEILKVEVEVEDRNQKWLRDISIINTYEDYLKYMKIMEETAIGDYSQVSNYNEKYFEENVIIVAEYVDESYSVDSNFLNVKEYKDEYIVKIKRVYPEILHEGVKQWCIFIPLEGKQWYEKEAKIDLDDKRLSDVVCTAETMWVSTIFPYSEVSSDTASYVIIDSYEEYKKYTEYIQQHRKYTNCASYRAESYNREYFENNLLLFTSIDGTENPYDAKMVTTITESGEIVLDIERAHDTKFGNNGLYWNVFIPLPGTDWGVDDITINYTDTYPYENK